MNGTLLAGVFGVCLLTGCGGGSGGGSNTAPNPTGTAAVHLVIDTAAGDTAVVQSQLIGVTLQKADGTTTDNLLTSPSNIVLANPTGEPAAIELPLVAAGSYTALRVAFAGGTSTAQLADGSQIAVDLTATTMTFLLEDNLLHNQSQDSWVGLRHARPAALTGSGQHRSWSPAMTAAPAADDSLHGSAMRIVHVDSGQNSFSATLSGDDHGLVHASLSSGSELFDDHGDRHRERSTWLSGINADDEVIVSGTLRQDGSVEVRCARHHASSSSAKLLGRITAVDSLTTTLEVDVLGTALHGNRTILTQPDHISLTVGSARIHDSDTNLALSFSDLIVGGRIKVDPLSRNGAVVAAREIEVQSRNGAPQFPEIEGQVGAIDLATNTITVLPRNNDPLWIGGVSVASATVRISPTTIMFRKASGGNDRTPITLTAIVPAQDRIWIRGALAAEGFITADWLRVRADH
ncbi:MAG: hypothetical protein NT107_12475 [Planctomycetota bacterium]|nr:hypothetical protein [Planctomycetota bacterium]